jgi:hypothetical protein
MEAIERLLGEIGRRIAARKDGESTEATHLASPEITDDLAILDAHGRTRPGVHMAGRAALCATCEQPMPCAALRALAAKYDVRAAPVDEGIGVQSVTGVVDPTGVQSTTPQRQLNHEDDDGPLA